MRRSLSRFRTAAAAQGSDASFDFRPLLLLAVTVFIDLLGFGLVLPNIPRYIELAVGTNHRHAAAMGGWLAASYSITQFVCLPFWGRYSDRVGRRPVILLSLIGVAGAYLLFGLAGNRLWMLFAARLLAGVLSSASIGVAFAYVADVTTPENRARGIGLLGACLGLGFMLGPAFGGFLGARYLALPAFVAMGMALVNFLFSLRYLPESLPAGERARRLAASAGSGTATPALLAGVLRGPAGFLFVLTFLITLGFSVLEQTFSFFLLSKASLGVTEASQPRVSGTILGLAGLIGVVIQGGLIGRLVARFGEGAITRAGIVCMALGFALFPLPGRLWLLIALPMTLLSVGRALAAPTLSALVSRKANLGQGLTLSTSQSLDALARSIGPVTGGALFSAYSPAVPYFASALVMTAALGLALARRRDMVAPADAPVTLLSGAAPDATATAVAATAGGVTTER